MLYKAGKDVKRSMDFLKKRDYTKSRLSNHTSTLQSL